MKKIATVLILLFTVNASIMAQQEKELKGFDVTREITINVSADQLWQMIGPEFENAYVWASSVDHSVGQGEAEFDGATCSERFCDVNAKGFSKISEKLTNYSETDMNLAYEVTDGMPGFIVKATNNWTVVAVDANTSKLVMVGGFRVKGLMGAMMKGSMEKKMTKLLDVVLNDAKVYAETGKPSENKQERITKLAKKNKIAA